MNGSPRADVRQLMASAREKRTIAIVSGKGGVGKSNIALNLSILLSATSRRVALVDADIGLADLDLLMDLNVRATLGHVIARQKDLPDVLVDLPSGVQFVPGASGLRRLTHLSEFQRAHLREVLAELEADNDVTLVDTGAGIGPDVLHFARAADAVLVVTAPEPTAMADGYALIKALAAAGFDGQLSVLVNFAADRHGARCTYQRIATVARQFLSVRVLDAGYVPADPKVRDAVRCREPFVLAYPRCPASRSLAALATKLCKGAGSVERKEGFFRRVASWFA